MGLVVGVGMGLSWAGTCPGPIFYNGTCPVPELNIYNYKASGGPKFHARQPPTCPTDARILRGWGGSNIGCMDDSSDSRNFNHGAA